MKPSLSGLPNHDDDRYLRFDSVILNMSFPLCPRRLLAAGARFATTTWPGRRTGRTGCARSRAAAAAALRTLGHQRVDRALRRPRQLPAASSAARWAARSWRSCAPASTRRPGTATRTGPAPATSRTSTSAAPPRPCACPRSASPSMTAVARTCTSGVFDQVMRKNASSVILKSSMPFMIGCGLVDDGVRHVRFEREVRPRRASSRRRRCWRSTRGRRCTARRAG